MLKVIGPKAQRQFKVLFSQRSGFARTCRGAINGKWFTQKASTVYGLYLRNLAD